MPTSSSGTKNEAYRANTIAITAMIPVCIVQNIAQPHRNPHAGENDSRRYAYTPPLSGKIEASSAQTRDPKRISTPQTTQTAMTPATVGT